MQFLKFFSDQSKSKLVDPNLFKMVFNYSGSAENAYRIKIMEMKDLIVKDGPDTMYWYHSWNHRSVKHFHNYLHMSEFEYVGKESTIDEWENFGKDVKMDDGYPIQVLTQNLELHEFEDGGKLFSWVTDEYYPYGAEFTRRDMRFESFDKYWRWMKLQLDTGSYINGDFGMDDPEILIRLELLE
jgi:hypothetical protein